MRSADEPTHPQSDAADTVGPEAGTPHTAPECGDGSAPEDAGEIDWLGAHDVPAARSPGRRTTLVVAVLGLVSALVALLLCCQAAGLLLSGLNDEVCRSQLCPPTRR